MGTINAIINGKHEVLSGVEAQIYKLHGEKAVLNRRGYVNQSSDFLKSTGKEKRTSQFTPRSTNDNVKPTGILEDNYD
jgi:hypothetical protein